MATNPKDLHTMIYLATPYWHADQAIRNARLLQAQLITRTFIVRGMPVFSPIVHGCGLNVLEQPVNLTNEEWVDLDLNFISYCSSVMIAQLDGWQQSKGMQREMTFCSERRIPMLFLTRTECDLIISRERLSLGMLDEAA